MCLIEEELLETPSDGCLCACNWFLVLALALNVCHLMRATAVAWSNAVDLYNSNTGAWSTAQLYVGGYFPFSYLENGSIKIARSLGVRAAGGKPKWSL